MIQIPFPDGFPTKEPYLAFAPHNQWWWAPRTGPRLSGSGLNDAVLVRDAGGYHVAATGFHPTKRCRFHSNPDPVVDVGGGPAVDLEDCAVFVSSDTPAKALHAAARAIQAQVPGLRLRGEKPYPDYRDLLGWCTWEAFPHQQVTAAGVEEALRAFSRSGWVPPFVILDDGWLDAEDDGALRSFEAHPAKFPDGLAELIRQAKETYGVRMFGIWHTLHGYWQGICPDSRLAKAYPLRCAEAALYPDWKKWAHRKRWSLEPESFGRFLRDWYEQLTAAGVDFVKVDSQASHSAFVADRESLTADIRRHQEELLPVVTSAFGDNYLACMCHLPEILTSRSPGNSWRASEDYHPGEPWFTQWQVWASAINSQWIGEFAWPDWDMFRSTDTHAWFSAAARVLGGSPVYLSDQPGEIDRAVLEACSRDAQIVHRYSRLPEVSAACILRDCHKERVLLRLRGGDDRVSALGIFHCYDARQADAAEPIVEAVSIQDFGEDTSKDWVVFSFRDQRAFLVRAGETWQVALRPLEFDVFSAVPVRGPLTVIGFTGKLAAGAGIVESGEPQEETRDVHLPTTGRLLIYQPTGRPIMHSAGRRVPATPRAETGFFEFFITQPGTVKIEFPSARTAPPAPGVVKLSPTARPGNACGPRPASHPR